MKFMFAGICLLLSLVVNAQEQSLKIFPVLYQQTAAEYRALCYQAFNMATLRLNEIPKKKFRKQKLAIITDLDETVLDNSYVEAQLIKDGKEYSNATWKNWMDKADATAVPGAVDFFKAAKQKGATIFYISNRDSSALQTTLANLVKLGLPDADLAHIMLQGKSTASKEPRRQAVASQYNVIMLLGDNLIDFMNVFEKGSVDERFAQTDQRKEEWGKKFIVLPNSIYGEWENALYNYERGKLTEAQRDAMRKALLKGY
jgi:5'-nucleotidase (lipoprotein e(P4) family)